MILKLKKIELYVQSFIRIADWFDFYFKIIITDCLIQYNLFDKIQRISSNKMYKNSLNAYI